MSSENYPIIKGLNTFRDKFLYSEYAYKSIFLSKIYSAKKLLKE